MSDEKTKKSLVSKDEIKRRGQQAIELLHWAGRKMKGWPPGVAGYAGNLVGVFEEKRKHPDADMMARAGVRIAQEQHNVDSIARQAGVGMSPEDIEKIPAIDEDWKASFMDEVKLVSDKEMRSLWANILRGKARDSNAFSKRTVKLVGEMEKKEAEMFTHFCQFVVSGGPMIYDHRASVYNKQGRMFDILKHLDAIGLVSTDTVAGYRLESKVPATMVSYFDKFVQLSLSKEKDQYFLQSGHALFTEAGRQLLPICGAQASDEFFAYLMEEWKTRNCKPKLLSPQEVLEFLFSQQHKPPPAS
ncbi:MAG: DUF2806 domain-containing protein [Gammaproteobacteria bacterium]